ncbi:MAG TPA: hypothetical protein VGM37_04095 [Armatimonadota bacterium]|jgi:hypothetical protein
MERTANVGRSLVGGVMGIGLVALVVIGTVRGPVDAQCIRALMEDFGRYLPLGFLAGAVAGWMRRDVR